MNDSKKGLAKSTRPIFSRLYSMVLMMLFQHHFCIHKTSSQCYKMKLYQWRWIYHSHLRFRLKSRINGMNSHVNPRRRKRRLCWRLTVPIWKNAGETDGNKKLHSISEVKFSRSSTPFDKDPYFPKLFYNMAAKISSKITHPHPLQQPPSSLLFPLKKAL